MNEDHKSKLRAGGAEEWVCPHCHKPFKAVSKGVHLKGCKLNPDRPGAPKRRNRRQDAECELCGKKMAKTSMQNHIDHNCRVAAAIREGRLTVPDPNHPAVPDRVIVDHVGDTIEVPCEPKWRKDLEDMKRHQLAREVIELAVDQVLEGLPLSYRQATTINDAVTELLATIQRAGG